MSIAFKLSESQTIAASLNYTWNKRILVVEDEKIIAETYFEMLTDEPQNNVVSLRSSRSQKPETTAQRFSNWGFEVVVTHNAEEALKVVQKSIKENNPFALGFFDVMLGEGMDGFELVKEIQKLDHEMNAVFVTAYNDRSIDSINEFLGQDKVNRWDYLNKPFNQSEILQKARNFVALWNLQREKKQHQAQLSELNQKILASERMSTVAAVSRGVAHEFGNILMQIMGKAEVSKNKSTEEMKAGLEKILDASQRAAEILDRFKNISSHTHDHMPKAVSSVNDLIDECLDLMNHQLKTHNIKINKLKEDTVSIEMNSTSILQVIVNLIINSTHAMNGNGGVIDLSLSDLEDRVELKIRDYGPGIPEEFIQNVTQAFFTTKGDKGTGLGLSISKEIIEIDHGGNFELINIDKGLEVIVTLPKKQGVEV